MTETALNIKIWVIEIYFYFACPVEKHDRTGVLVICDFYYLFKFSDFKDRLYLGALYSSILEIRGEALDRIILSRTLEVFTVGSLKILL